jgi:hypothetical protein
MGAAQSKEWEQRITVRTLASSGGVCGGHSTRRQASLSVAARAEYKGEASKHFLAFVSESSAASKSMQLDPPEPRRPSTHPAGFFRAAWNFQSPVCHLAAIFTVKLAHVDKTRLTGRPDHPHRCSSRRGRACLSYLASRPAFSSWLAARFAI